MREMQNVSIYLVLQMYLNQKNALKKLTLKEKPNMQKHIVARPSKKVALATNLQIYLLARSSQLLSSYSDHILSTPTT